MPVKTEEELFAAVEADRTTTVREITMNKDYIVIISNYHAHDNNFLSSWSFWAGGEYSVTYDQTSQTVQQTEATGTITTGNKENL